MAQAVPLWLRLLDRLCCPVCRDSLDSLLREEDPEQGIVGHGTASCTERYPIIDGIPRLLVGAARGAIFQRHPRWFAAPQRRPFFTDWPEKPPDGSAGQLVSRFDEEWARFSKFGEKEHADLFAAYFDLISPDILGDARLLVDAGCGAGRWAFEAQRRGATVIAIDMGFSVEAAAGNTSATGRVLCVQADILYLPIRPGAADLVYSLGVLHHVKQTGAALRSVVDAVRPGGLVLVYLYYALDGRGPAYRALFSITDRVRRVTSRLPQPLLALFADTIAITIYLPLARLSRVLRLARLSAIAERLPLSFYADLSIEVMRNDSIDRFGTLIEKRYRREEVRSLLESSGLSQVIVSQRPPWWHATGVKPRDRRALQPMPWRRVEVWPISSK